MGQCLLCKLQFFWHFADVLLDVFEWWYASIVNNNLHYYPNDTIKPLTISHAYKTGFGFDHGDCLGYMLSNTISSYVVGLKESGWWSLLSCLRDDCRWAKEWQHLQQSLVDHCISRVPLVTGLFDNVSEDSSEERQNQMPPKSGMEGPNHALLWRLGLQVSCLGALHDSCFVFSLTRWRRGQQLEP